MLPSQNERRRHVVLLAAVGVMGLLTVGLAWPDGPRSEDGEITVDQSRIEKAVFRCWREVTLDKAGRTFNQPCDMTAWRFAADEMEVWDFSGDLSPCILPWRVRIDATRTPMRLDIINHRGPHPTVLPGIFKLERGQMVLVTPAWDEQWPARNSSGEYADRPTSFTSTRKNGYDKRVLVPCDLYEQVRAP